MGKLGSLFVSEAVKDETAHLVAQYRQAFNNGLKTRIGNSQTTEQKSLGVSSA